MKLIASAAMVCLVPMVASANVVELSDHSRPRAQVKTYHAKCANGRLVMIRWDPTAHTICAAVQDGSQSERCMQATADTAAPAVRNAAVSLCR